MAISNARTVEGRRDSDNYLAFQLGTPFEEELAEGYTLSLRFRHDSGGGDTVLMTNEEADLLYSALDEWIYGV